jgi:hypothetical protein
LLENRVGLGAAMSGECELLAEPNRQIETTSTHCGFKEPALISFWFSAVREHIPGRQLLP